jgi:hypothetical protein
MKEWYSPGFTLFSTYLHNSYILSVWAIFAYGQGRRERVWTPVEKIFRASQQGRTG